MNRDEQRLSGGRKSNEGNQAAMPSLFILPMLSILFDSSAHKPNLY
jgi:hypothetical protein